MPHGTTEAFGNMRGKTSADFWRKVRCLVIDEISMVDAEFLDWRGRMVGVPPLVPELGSCASSGARLVASGSS